ncbi:MAG: hypothetical protein COA71_06900 [SAR86 cluster bacterium]|uniref:Uncharacterized protein n=1 Tax=SAR86 cluster bacterium TaxID=2030880 RepID=A0A2A5CCW6_9GAMM|nr:hypothetical protein [Gammaproteobacteria bacterium AH-315-E17]PCJ41734.1 MAG: hypothetical protein COA71_06900 [SAR86 cluster bacterium]
MIKRLFCLAILGQAFSVHAQEADIVGSWNQPAPGLSLGGVAALFGFIEDAIERADGPPVVDFLGIPLNEEALSRALAYDSALLGVPEHVCMRHPSQYSYWGPAQLRIAAQLDYNLDAISYTIGGTFRRADRTIWLDGRDHPSEYAPHTWAGFTTGHWENGTLITTTTHLKWGWIRRNGVPSSDQATVTTYYQRNGDVLTITWFVDDPHYLTDTYIKSVDFIVTPRGISTASFTVEAADTGSDVFSQCLNRAEIFRPELHYVPHYLPGENPFIGEWAEEIGVPVEATLGGAETAYPEYKEQLQE